MRGVGERPKGRPRAHARGEAHRRMVMMRPCSRASVAYAESVLSASKCKSDYCKPLVLQALMGYSTEEIAGQMGLTRSAVLTRLHRARLKVRVALGTTDVADGTSAVRTIKATPQSCAA
jgi:predicted DNA-binding protein (UPF0251 family)